MCGIAGYIGIKNSATAQNETDIKEMTKVLKHRGPDSSDMFVSSNAILGNTRLSIIDISDNGNLPMCNSDKSIWLCYNGEVSNFKELKQKYQLDKKFHFKSTTDTEVVLYLYELLGIDFLQELSGMFAFCIYDSRKQLAYIVRDFYGILPCYFSFTPDGLYFASEIKAFHSIHNINLTLNKTALQHYFSLGYMPDNLTPFNEITELRPSEFIKINLAEKRHSFHTYYSFNYKENHSIGEKEAIETTRELLIGSVKRNLVSDAPLGMTLSGGIDTSAMLGIVKYLGLSKRMHTFSLRMGEKSFDESPYQRLMAEYANSIHHEITVKPEDVIENIVTQIAYTDEPNVNGACIPSFILAKHASKHVKVLLSGEGGDELFNAYPTIAAYQYRKLYRKAIPKFLRSAIQNTIHALPANYSKLSFDFKAKRFTSGVELDTPDAHLHWRYVFTENQKSELLTTYNSDIPTVNYYRKLFYESGIEHDINRLSLIDMRHFFIDDLMVKNDRTFLANSVEGRFPFMDRILVDYVTQLPVKYRVKGFSGLRWVEKEAMKPFFPNEIYKRDGFGLEMPHAIWFLDELGTFAEKYLNKKFVEQTEILNWNYVEQIWKIHLSGKQDFGRPLWSILNFLIWFDLFVLNKNHTQYRN
ncbi:MAG: asparagine synthase (glutamine-hydrolyzing) [Chitinophagales bacterium]|nr:asparagine synthase (glutamine-hydrolyzing) [Chitinophagales bacterium]OJV25967.1 MAG: asparagine synthase (glutamine-hydrolyzing) [Bacteroidetes bacterium 37-13]